MNERMTPEQERAICQAKMRQDTADRTVIATQYSALELFFKGVDMERSMEAVGEDRGLQRTVFMDGEQHVNRFFNITEEGDVLTIHAIAEVQKDITDEIDGVGMSSGNEYLDFSDEEFRKVQNILKV